MAPEIIAGQKYNAAVDWYSLGIIIYQLVTGVKAWECDVSDLPTYHLDTDTENIIEELLCEDPKRRLGINNSIRDHPFFHHIQWDDLEALNIPPPFIPL
ncbi:RAC family serine/threonine-protein kinase homolog [Engystomops pustulosus]|uniref:RAC family serine/threonine-protein kinase homolog n=1 Tax=Engystomops pustulosus TaxID=76066 RepID=UPI003AFADF3B